MAESGSWVKKTMSIKALRTLCKRFYRLGSARGLFLDYNALQAWRNPLHVPLFGCEQKKLYFFS